MKTLSALVVALSFGLAAACGGGGSDPKALCDHLASIAKKEGGEAEEMWNKRLKDDCEKEIKEAKEELGDKYDKFAKCVMGKDKLSDAFKDCDPDDMK